MRIQHNIMSMNAYRNYNNNAKSLSGNLEKLSSGYKINRAGDDAAGLAISEKMRGQIAGLDAAQKNVKDGISLVKTAEGAMQEVQDMLKRMKYLATQSANGTYQEVDRKNLQMEVDELQAEIDRIGDTANFNGIKLLNGDWDAGKVTPPGGATAGGLTDADITAPTATATTNFADGDGTTTPATAKFDFADVAFAADGDVTVSFGGKDYDVAVTKDMTDAEFAQAFVDAYNADKLDDTGAAGEITAALNGTEVTFTAAANTALGDTTIKDALSAGAPTIAPKAPADGADAAKGPTFTENAGATDTKLADYDLASLDLSGVKGLTAEGDVEIEYDGAAQTLKVTVGGKTYEGTVANNKGAGGETIELFTAGDADGTGDDGKITVETVAATTKLGADSVAGDAIAKAAVGKAAAAADAGGGLTLQIGDSAGETLDVSIGKIDSATLGIKGIDISTDAKSANAAIDKIKAATDYVSSVRGQLGAYQNRLEHTANNLSVMAENIQDAESTIRDTDVADEMMSYVKNNILVQSAQAMLAQANQVPQGVLQLLG